jgi:ABC-2 type transport system ATP-binding protein
MSAPSQSGCRASRFPRRRRSAASRRGRRARSCWRSRSATPPELLVLDDPTLGLDVVARRALCEEIVGELADRGTTVFLTTHDLAAFEGIATRVGILKEGRLALDEDLEALRARFRRIRYTNRLTETRTAYGTELDEFHAMRVQVRGWGIDAVVSNFDEAAFERLRAVDGVENVEASAMPLEEIFLAVAGEEKREGAAA